MVPGRSLSHSTTLSLASEEREVRVVQLFFDGVLHEVLQDRGPAGHLVGLLGDPLLASSLPILLAVALKRNEAFESPWC